jgi:hypothetical protein
MSEIGDAIKALVESSAVYSEICKVVSVNNTERTCIVEPINGESNYEDIRLQTKISDTVGLYVKPAVGSTVMVAFYNEHSGYVSQFSEIDSIELKVNNTIVINGGDNGGLLVKQKLVSELQKYSAVLTNLQTAINSFVPAGTLADAATLGALLKDAMTAYSSPTYSDIENTKFKH